MDQLAPLLKDIFMDFSSFLAKTLTGSHGQELLNEGDSLYVMFNFISARKITNYRIFRTIRCT